jgi:hypothetical protein
MQTITRVFLFRTTTEQTKSANLWWNRTNRARVVPAPPGVKSVHLIPALLQANTTVSGWFGYLSSGSDKTTWVSVFEDYRML